MTQVDLWVWTLETTPTTVDTIPWHGGDWLPKALHGYQHPQKLGGPAAPVAQALINWEAQGLDHSSSC